MDAGAVADDPARRRNGRRALRYGCASLLTLVGAVVLCCGLVVAQWVGSVGSQARPATTPMPIKGSAVLLDDTETVVYSDPDGICRGPVLSVTETPARVGLSLTETDSELAECVRFGGLAQPIQVGLASPLGSRALIDQTTGLAVPYFDQSRGLRVVDGQTHVGSLTLTESGPVSTNEPYFGGPGAAVMVQTFLGNDASQLYATTDFVRIIQVSGGGWHPPVGTMTSPVTVRGHAGLAADGVIVWTESGLTVAVTGTGPSTSSNGSPLLTHGPPLATARLIGIAYALLGGGS
jgi:hypothetical protein